MASDTPAGGLPWLRELPEDSRRALPALQVGGAVHAEDRRSRFLLLNGQVVHEGTEVAPGLVLEQIQPGQAVFSLRGQRWRLPL